jgi:hypothetical protein
MPGAILTKREQRDGKHIAKLFMPTADVGMAPGFVFHLILHPALIDNNR